MANQNSSLGSANGVKFGVFGYCAKAGCSSIQVGYATDDILSSLSSALKRQRFISPFNLPSTTRNNLSNVLLAHPVAGGLTLVMLLLSIIGHSSKASGSSRYHTALLILSFLTSLVTLLAFLVDILIFVPNLDWGTYVTLAATILNAGATLALCVSQRRLKTRNAMRSRIAENDDYQP
ncbi:SUR7/PalI family-domain-containing protein, partial [Protomyces lactucae-debilis]